MSEETKRIVEALRHVGHGLAQGDTNCSKCPMQEIPIGELECGSDCPTTLMLLAADLIEEQANVKEQLAGMEIMLTCAQSAAETYKRERDRYWEWIKGMECETCSGDCAKCKDYDGWVWSGMDKGRGEGD